MMTTTKKTTKPIHPMRKRLPVISEPLSLFIGMPRTGKTARMMAHLASEKRVVLIEPKCSQLTRLKGWEHFYPRYVPASSGRALGVWDDSRLVNYLRPFAGNSKRFRAVVHVRNSFKENLSLLCRLLMAVKNCVLAVDELAFFAAPGSNVALGTYMQSVMISGSHDGMKFMATAQGFSMIHRTIRMAADRILFYRSDERNDLALVKGKLPPTFAAQVPRLADHVCVDWGNGRSPVTDESLKGKLAGVLPGARFKPH